MSGPAGRDAGLQVERTVLAWRRTAAAFVVAALVVGRVLAPPLGYPALLVTAPVGAVALAALAGALARRAPTGRATVAPERWRPAPRLMAVVALGTPLAGLAVAVATLLTRQ